MNEMINCQEKENFIIVSLPIELRNFVWSNSYGKIQKALRHLTDDITDVLIDARRIEWADPFPMLSILLSIAEIHLKKTVFFLVPELDTLTECQKRVFEFLEKGGFLSEMQRFGVYVLTEDDWVKWVEKKEIDLNSITKERLEQIKKLEGYIYFRNSTILQAKVVDLAAFDSGLEIEKEIEKWMDQIVPTVRQYHQDSRLNELIWKMGLFLKETINNIYEHAYYGNKHKYAGYYIRQRVGLSDNTLTKDERDNIEKSFNKEFVDLPRFVKHFPMDSTNFLEIFVIDAGIGLTECFTSTRKDKKIHKSFTEAWRETVGHGERTLNSEKYTQFGGLYSLGKLLKDEFFMCRDFDCWIGAVLPVEEVNAAYRKACSSDDSSQFVQGLAVMCRLAIQKPMDTNWISVDKDSNRNSDATKINATKIINCFIDVANEEHSIYEKYFHSTFRKLPYNPSYIKDERFDLSFMKDDGMNYLECKGNVVEYCVFLPASHVSKNRIYSYIEEIQSLLGISNKSRTVIIADIPVCECGLYQLALENGKFKENFTTQVERIIMISQRLSVRVLCKVGKTYMYSKSETNNFVQCRPTFFSPHLSLFHALEWLKTHDSMIVWQYIVKNNETGCFFVPQKVSWYKDNDDKILDGYLDFEKTLTDVFLKSVYHNALHHTLCLSGSSKSKCIYQSEDPLMTGMATYMNTLAFNKSSDQDDLEEMMVSLGSVYVSGAHQNTDAKHHINMFLHKGSNQFEGQNPIMHLLAWPEKELFPEKEGESLQEKAYRRVGSTYAIAPFGWRYFPIPRYKAKSSTNRDIVMSKIFFEEGEIKKNDIVFESIYRCPPPETYHYWQGRNGMFIGISHVDYETKHDIFHIDFPFIVKESFLLGGDLACFLLGEIASAFSLDDIDLEFHGNEKFKDDVRKYIAKYSEKYNNRKCSFLIYPYHPNTERIIEIIKDYIKTKDIPMIPLVPLNKERNGTTFQPSPLTIEMLRNKICSFGEKEVNALFLDDAIVDGKTQEEIKHIMYWLGVHDVMSVFILERRRMPYSTSNNLKSSVFWRLDIPRLGSKYSCPLCTAINSIKDFLPRIVYKNASERVGKWLNLWEGRTESTIEHIHTLSPQRIQLEQPRKRFGIYFEGAECKQCGGESNKIELNTSLGLTMYMGELLSITSRDDKMLQYCSEKYHLDSLTLLEMLCTNLLLYGNTISRKVREKIVFQIFKHANLVDCNPHTAFAALVLLTQELTQENNSVLKCSIKDTCEAMVRNNKRPNYDMLILLSYLGERDSEFDYFEDAKKMRKMSKPDIEVYNQFHSTLYNDNGKIHSKPLARLKDKDIDSMEDIQRGLDSLDCLSDALSNISEWNLYKRNESNDSISKAKLVIEKKKETLKNALINLSNDNTCFEQERFNCSRAIEELYTELSKVHERLFLPLNLKNTFSRTTKFDLLEKIKIWKNQKRKENQNEYEYDIGIFNFERKNVENSSNIFEKWMIWDQTVNDEMEYLIHNANNHSENKKISGLKFGVEGEHKVWTTIEYEENLSSISVLFYNKTTPEHNAAYITRETAKKTRYSKSRFLNELHIKVSYKDIDDNIIQTKIEFPLI